MKSNLSKLCLVIFVTSLLSLPASSIYAGAVSSSREKNFKEANELYWTGKRLMEEGNYQAANEAFKKAQTLLEEKSPLTQGAQDLQTPLKGSPKTESKAVVQKKESKGVYLKGIEARIKKADLYYDKAIEFLKNKQYQEAGETLEEAVKLNPKDKDGYYNLGVLNEMYLNDKKKALLYYQKYIHLAPDSENAKEVKTWVEEINKQQVGQ
jgi:tetratricopeptide (TPR) repeat protein